MTKLAAFLEILHAGHEGVEVAYVSEGGAQFESTSSDKLEALESLRSIASALEALEIPHTIDEGNRAILVGDATYEDAAEAPDDCTHERIYGFPDCGHITGRF